MDPVLRIGTTCLCMSLLNGFDEALEGAHPY